ncbi:MAG TPA: DUF1501 domain-containing protein [Planctomycetaceae bacterium]|nr:sulfatase [Blastopirellula sp.]HAY81705.1 DUF1501 domain-containing protein [Planctomycetaceae bacterium]
MRCNQFQPTLSRRDMLRTSGCGIASVALAAIAGQQSLAAAGNVQGIHHAPRAKRIIFLFMWGGPSHVDTFDPKPRLAQEDGKPLAGKSVGSDRQQLGQVLASPFRFAQHGEGGVWLSELFPHLAKQADRLCIVRSMHTEGQAHGEALLRLHTGQANLVRPSVGAWVSYGLGSDNENLPAFVTVSPPRGHGGVQNYGSSFLPARHQGTAIGSAETPIAQASIPNLVNQQVPPATQLKQLQLIQALNRRHLHDNQVDKRIEGLIANYELAFRMQSTIPDIMDLGTETQDTLDLYGVDQKPTDNFARQCLLARKLAERGVRYIQVSTNYTWDHHQKVQEGSITESAKVDRPIAGLLADLARRGLLEDTLVVWGAEFGRTPTAENGHGRNHHPQGFTMWMAGGGVRGGFTYGATDDFGYAPVENHVHMHDLHATLLHALGLDHQRLTYRHAGRDFRLTDVFGNVAHGIFG